MSDAMLADIRRQPSCLAALLDRGDGIREQGAVHLAPPAAGRLAAVGSGDGWFAARAVELLARRGCMLPYRPWSSLEFLCYEAPRVGPADRILAISMSGNVDRVIDGIAEARARGAATLLVTNGDGGRLANVVGARCSLEISDIAPFLCGTSSYTATVLALWLLLDGARGPRGGDAPWQFERSAVAAAVRELPPVIAEADGFARQVAEVSAGDGISGARFLSAGPNLATADYGAAKLVELTRVPVWSDDLEEFAHRQYWSMDVKNLVIYVSANQTVAKLAADSAEALTDLGIRTVAIEAAGCAVPTARHRLVLAEMPEWISPLLLAIPMQLLGYYLARATGLDPDTRRHLKDDAVRFRVSRKLTRRWLIGTGR